MLPDLDILNKILKLREHIDTIGQNLGNNIFQTLGDYLDADSDLPKAVKDHIKAALQKVSLSEAQLKKIWAKLEQEIEGEIPEKLRPLLKSFAEFKLAKPGKVQWPLEFKKDFPANAAISASFKVELSQSAMLRAYPSPPEIVSDLLAEDQAVLCLSNSSQIKADAQASAQLNNGAFNFSSAGEASLTLENYYRHEPTDLFGVAILESLATQPAGVLTPLPLPFIDGMVAKHFLPHPTLVLAGFKRQGKLDSSAELGLAAPAALAGGIISSLSLDLSASLSLEGSFQTRVARLDAQTINIAVQSDASTASEASLGASVGIDINKQMGRVHSVLSLGLDEGKALIDRLQFDWSLSEEFTQSLGRELKKLGSGADWNSFVDSLFSPQAAKKFIKTTLEDLDDEIDALAEDASIEITEYISVYIEEAFAGVPSAMRNKLKNAVGGNDVVTSARDVTLNAVTTRTEAFIEALRNDTKGTVSELIGQPKLAVIRPLVERLETVDNKLADVRDKVTGYLERYLKQLESLASISKVLSENEIKLAVSMLRAKKTSNNKVIDVDFSKAAAGQHSDAIDALLCGKPDAVIDLARANAPGITVNDCLIKRLSKTSRETGLSIAVLDFKLSSKSLLTEEVTFSENPVTGVITVGSKGNIKKSKDVFGDSRSIELVNVFQLSNARQSGKGSIGITFNRSEDQLNKSELDSFLGSFVTAKLITEQQEQEAVARAHGDSSSIVEDAEIVAGLRWNAEHMARLFNQASGRGVDFIIDQVAREMNELQVIPAAWIHQLQVQINTKVLKLGTPDIELDADKPGDVLQYFLRQPALFDYLQADDAKLRQNHRNTVDILVKWHEHAVNLHAALESMSEVYYSGGELSVEDYEDYTKDINDSLQGWIKDAELLEMALCLLPFVDPGRDDQIKSSMVALLKILNRLSAGTDIEHSTLSVVMTVGEGNKKKLTTLI